MSKSQMNMKSETSSPLPPYTDADHHHHQEGGGSSSNNYQSQIQQLPSSLNLYPSHHAQENPSSHKLGEFESQPLYVVETSMRKQNTIIYSGTNRRRSLPLASATTNGSAAIIQLFLPPSSHKHSSGSAATPQERTYYLQSASSFPHSTYRFEVEVARSSNSSSATYTNARETFEWRRSRGAEIRALGNGSESQGWKLVRIDGGNAAGEEAMMGGGGVVGADGPMSSDGKAVVAAWAFGVSATKSFCFRFFGVGLDGALGERWTLVAVVTAIWMWGRERRERAKH